MFHLENVMVQTKFQNVQDPSTILQKLCIFDHYYLFFEAKMCNAFEEKIILDELTEINKTRFGLRNA